MEVRRLETNVLPTNHSEFGGGGEERVEVLGDRQQEPVEEKGAGVLGEHTALLPRPTGLHRTERLSPTRAPVLLLCSC